MTQAAFRKLVIEELWDGKLRGPSWISVPHNLNYELVLAEMKLMVKAGQLEFRNGRFRLANFRHSNQPTTHQAE